MHAPWNDIVSRYVAKYQLNFIQYIVFYWTACFDNKASMEMLKMVSRQNIHTKHTNTQIHDKQTDDKKRGKHQFIQQICDSRTRLYSRILFRYIC